MVRVIFKIVTRDTWVVFYSNELRFSLQERDSLLDDWLLCCPPEFYAFSPIRRNHPLGVFPMVISSHELGFWGSLSYV